MSSRSDIRSSCVERFLRYVTLDTRSEEDQEAFPSTSKQLDLLRLLVDELKGIGLLDASIDEHGYVFATIPATTKKAGVPVLGFIAHVDTSPEVSGSGVKPIVHPRYDGRDLALPGDPTQVIRLAENPALRDQMGNDIITASGTTLLGADNKAGVAEIVGVAEVLIAHPEIPHGRIRIGFTPDEEVGNGTKFFDVARFGAQFAYTIDGETLGEIEMETFSADSMTVTFQGFNTHPGLGKGKLVNAIKIAADFIGRLPKDGLSPETTEGYEGYVHPYVMQGVVDRTSVKFLIRDFVTAGLKGKEDLLERLARETVLRDQDRKILRAIGITDSRCIRNGKHNTERHHGMSAAYVLMTAQHRRQALERHRVFRWAGTPVVALDDQDWVLKARLTPKLPKRFSLQHSNNRPPCNET